MRNMAQVRLRALAFERAHSAQCITVKNEELTLDPREGFERIFAHLGEPYREACSEYFATHRINSSFQRDARGDASRLEPPDPWTKWTRAQRLTFIEEAGDILIATGYASVEGLASDAGGEWESALVEALERIEPNGGVSGAPIPVIGDDLPQVLSATTMSRRLSHGLHSMGSYSPDGSDDLPPVVLVSTPSVWLEERWAPVRAVLRAHYERDGAEAGPAVYTRCADS